MKLFYLKNEFEKNLIIKELITKKLEKSIFKFQN